VQPSGIVEDNWIWIVRGSSRRREQLEELLREYLVLLLPAKLPRADPVAENRVVPPSDYEAMRRLSTIDPLGKRG
jgi:hypothetical protein